MTIALDVAIGLVFLYLLLALIVTTVQELIASLFRLRAKHLYDAIAGMLEVTDEQGNASAPKQLRELFEHPLIRNLTDEKLKLNAKGKPSPRGIGLPSYIPSKTFALALIDVLRDKRTATSAVGASEVLADAATAVASLPDSPAKKALLLLLTDTKDLATTADEQAKIVSQRIEAWFNDRMARASGWYKRKAQAWSLAIAIVVTLAANADTIHVVNRLWNDAALRTAVVASAQTFAASQAAPVASTSTPAGSDPVAETRSLAELALRQARGLESSYLPVGWKWELKSKSFWPCVRLEPVQPEAGTAKAKIADKPIRCWQPSWRDYVLLFAGWIITTLAVSLGAAFWFDVLSKALQLRGSGPRVSESSGKVESS